MSQIKKSYHAISSTYADTAKNIFAISEIVCTFAAFKITIRHKTVGKSSRPFLCPLISNCQVNRLAVCGSSNARKDKYGSPEQHRKSFLFNVQKYHTMNDNRRTAGETAMMGATYAERKEYMQKCLAESSTAILVYFDENCQIKTYGIAERGFESALLPMLEQASEKARRVAEEVML